MPEIAAFKRDFLQGLERSIKDTSESEQHVDHRQAAVLILVYPGEQELELVLTKRSAGLSTHAGQISLPGGIVELNDSSHIQTALRESEEEIGLDISQVDVLGTLKQIPIPSGFAVSPIIGVMAKSQSLQAAPAEVEEIFTIPLSLILDKAFYQQDYLTRNGVRRSFYYFDYKGHYVWGATAAILRSLALIVTSSSPDYSP